VIHYFVEDNGFHIDEEDVSRGYYTKDVNPNMFLSKKTAMKQAVRELKSLIKEADKRIAEYQKELGERP
jgi:lipid-binding SYLF domain-containing protein